MAEQFEYKTVIAPASGIDARELFDQHAKTYDPRAEDMSELYTEAAFAKGPEGKAQKLEFGKSGGIIVQRAVLVVRNKAEVLLIQRRKASEGASGHLITVGHSVLTSGSPSMSAEEILRKKLTYEPEASECVMQPAGYAYGDPEATGGIPYLFEVFRADAANSMRISSKNDDAASFSSIGDALQAIRDKHMEVAVLSGMIRE